MIPSWMLMLPCPGTSIQSVDSSTINLLLWKNYSNDSSQSEHARVCIVLVSCLYRAWAAALTKSGQLPAQQRVPAISVLPAFETQSEKNSSTMLTQNMSGVSYVSSCGPFREAPAAPSCDASFFPEDCRSGACGCGSALEKNLAQVTVVQLIPIATGFVPRLSVGWIWDIFGLWSFIQGYKPVQIWLQPHQIAEGPLPTCRAYHSDWIGSACRLAGFLEWSFCSSFRQEVYCCLLFTY
jgi:hypothetical protein